MQRTKVCKFGRLKKEEHIKVIFHALLKAIHTQAESKSPDLVDVSHHIFCPGMIVWPQNYSSWKAALRKISEKLGFQVGMLPALAHSKVPAVPPWGHRLWATAGQSSQPWGAQWALALTTEAHPCWERVCSCRWGQAMHQCRSSFYSFVVGLGTTCL